MIRVLLIAFCLLLPGHAHADNALLETIRTKARTIESIASDFTQEKHLEMFDEVLISQGHFAFSRPDRLRWEYTAPFKAGFLLKGDKGTEWDDATGEQRDFTLSSSPAMGMIARQIMAWTTFDIDWLKSRYAIRRIHTSPLVLELKPQGETAKEFLAHLLVEFTPDGRAISQLELHETDGDFTRIFFTDQAINAPLSRNLFDEVR